MQRKPSFKFVVWLRIHQVLDVDVRHFRLDSFCCSGLRLYNDHHVFNERLEKALAQCQSLNDNTHECNGVTR
jgi:hypothetical protein